MRSRGDTLFQALMVFCAVAAAWSFLGAPDKPTWAFEVAPLTAVVAVFAARRRRFRFSAVAYVLLTWFFFVQCVGGRWTFAEVPIPEAVMELFGLERNPADRVLRHQIT